MKNVEVTKAKRRAIVAEEKLIRCYRQMAHQSPDPKVRSVLRDMMLMEEMNEILLKTLH
ncbi:hypothetical protein KKA15_04560 [Patescibacteria group bacterium]|nr:hypothetical protein [Patescibacteria group bacterium]